MISQSLSEVERVDRLLFGCREFEEKCRQADQTSKSRIPSQATRLFERAGYGAALRKRLFAYTIIGILLPLFLVPFFGVKVIPLSFVPPILAYWVLRRAIFSRAENFERDYPALLLSLASSVRTGLDPLSALSHSAELFQPNSEMRGELVSLRERVESGDSEENAIRSFGSRIEHPDIRLFRTAFILSRREGSSLGECLQRLTKVTRQRQSFRRKARSAVAMQRLSSFGIALCTVLIGLIQVVMNPQAVKEAINHPIGVKALSLGGILIFIGLAWMLRLGRTRI